MNYKKIIPCTLSAAIICASLTGFGSRGYSDYAACYNKVTANGGLDVSIEYSCSMDGETTSGTGTLKMDAESNQMAYEMDMNDGSVITEYSDGENLYVNNGTEVTKTSIKDGASSSDNQQDKSMGSGERDDSQGAPTFDVSSFVGEFASYMEVNKIKEMGLLDAIPQAAVSKTTYDDGSYELTINTDAISAVMINQETGDGTSEVPEVSNLKDFTYVATETDGIITGVKMTGKVDVKVPGSLMSDGNEANYTMDLTIDLTFNNPGEKVTVEVPSNITVE